MADFAIVKVEIETDFPDWKVWRSDAGRWYATRAGRLTDQQLLSGYAMTVVADTADGLRGRLGDQPCPGEESGRPAG